MCYNTRVNLGDKPTERVDRESPVPQTATGVTRDSRELLCPVAAELRLEVGRRWSLTAAPTESLPHPLLKGTAAVLGRWSPAKGPPREVGAPAVGLQSILLAEGAKIPPLVLGFQKAARAPPQPSFITH